MEYASPTTPACDESLRLEGVTCCVGFDDILDVTLSLNHAHFDSFIVVTSHEDKATQKCAQKHGAHCVQTDLFKKNGRKFNKGAAINAGFDRFQFHGWRMHLDADIVVPDNFRRLLFNHSHLERSCIYGCDRVDVVGRDALAKLRKELHREPQAAWRCLVNPRHHAPPGARYVDPLRGYVPIGFFQLWHAHAQKPYPYSLGTAAHDDVMFAASWPESHRRLLPTGFVYHLAAQAPKWGENWDGHRKQPRF
ncbi:MAG TPA: hypothetical protein VGO11_19630 [Chthoniobacteraceae bacterium]|jgi:hypothetical protein|nr:hypothetical protein [Chthoniobacteraceae bacterium]